MSANRKYIALLILVMMSAYYGCKKGETVFVDVEKPYSKFETIVRVQYSNTLISGTAALVDSNFYFKNLSDSTGGVTYKWDFGDGGSSIARHPRHKYSAPGKYKVKLVISRDGVESDAFEVELSAIIGEKYFPVGINLSTNATALLELKNNDLLLLGFTHTRSDFYTRSYFLMTIGSDLKQKALKIFPTAVRLSSVAECSDGNLIATGTLSGKEYSNELFKLSPDGQVIWSKTMPATDNFQLVQETADGGYILTGSRNIKDQWGVNDIPKTLIVKLNGTGERQWEKFFGTGSLILEQAQNVIIEADGFVVAGNKRRDTDPYCNCDSLAVVKLNMNGSTAWKTTVQWALNRETVIPVSGSKLKNGNYEFSSYYADGLFIISPEGKFVDRALVNDQIISTSATEDGDIAVLSNNGLNGFRSILYGYSSSGIYKWSYRLKGIRPVGDGYMCCADSWPVMVKPLKGGGSVFVSNHVVPEIYDYIPVIVKIDKNGQPL